tara:strand:+ start:3163 stop:3804 length:642 start_codon:yes stop_codon:yes gene_type:complete
MAKNTSRRHLGHTKGDDDPYKAFPASIAALVAGLRQNWGAISGDLPEGTVQSRPKFGKNPPPSFLRAVENVTKKFKGLNLQKTEHPGVSISKLETGGGTEKTNDGDRPRLHYWHLRVISDWIGLSVAQLVMATHFISVERRAQKASDKERIPELRRLHDQYSSVLREIDVMIREGESSPDPVFYTIVENDPHGYHPKEDVIQRLVKAANRKKI